MAEVVRSAHCSEEARNKLDHPAEATGVLHAVLIGVGASLIALLVAQFFPTIIPARAGAVNL